MTAAPTAATRTVKGIEFPAPGIWMLDQGHADVGFAGRHFMLNKVRGRFTKVDATIHIAEDPTESRVEATIDIASVDSGDNARDDHLRSPDHFDVERFPTATFQSTRLRWDGGQQAIMTGDLTIKAITKQLDLEVSYRGFVTDPWGNERAVFSARGLVARSDFGLTWNMLLDNGGLLVSKQIELILDAEFVRA